jgi:hypothetical protein
MCKTRERVHQKNDDKLTHSLFLTKNKVLVCHRTYRYKLAEPLVAAFTHSFHIGNCDKFKFDIEFDDRC